MAKKRTKGAEKRGRKVELRRKTKETDINLDVDLDGKGAAEIDTGIGFFDHMLEALARHGALDLKLVCRGDTHIDDHHSVEDVGLAMGDAFAKALGDKAGIRRFGFASVPLDEALSQVSVDLSGRAHFAYRGGALLGRGKVGTFDVELMEDFLRAFASASGMTLHIDLLSGRNAHHIVEATIKAFARALRQAVEFDPRITDVPSTKGVL